MNEKYFPFNSVNGDRKFKAEDWSNYFKQTLTTGAFPSPAMGLKVVSNNNMTLTIKPGSGNIEGYFYTLFENKTIRVEAAGTTARTDLIVLRWSKLNRNISIEVLKNTNSRLWNEEFKDLILARVTIRPLIDSILDADILDTRLSTECGIVNSLMQADTEEIFQQYESWFNYNKDYYDTHIQNWTGIKQHEFESWTREKQEEFTIWSKSEKEKFIVWFDSVKGVLDGDTVGNILNKINANTEQLVTLKENVANKVLELENHVNAELVKIIETNIELEKRVDEKIQSVKGIDKKVLVFRNERVETLEITNIPEHEHYEINLTTSGYSNSMNIFINGTLIESVSTSNTGSHYGYFSCFIKNNEIFYSIDLSHYSDSTTKGHLLNAVTFNKIKQLKDGLKSLKITYSRNEPSTTTLNILGY